MTERAGAGTQVAAHAGDGTVWVVDDDRAVRFVLATALREGGHAVREFGSAAEALAALRDGALRSSHFHSYRR